MPDQKVLTETLRRVFEEGIPFNKHLGLKLTQVERGKACIEIEFRPEYIGDVPKNIVHGGILSTLVDVTGGATAFTVLDYPREISLNTVDMRVDYVRMGRGERFIATGSVIRKGNRICVTHIDVHNDEGTLIAIGTATYSIFSADRNAPEKAVVPESLMSIFHEVRDELTSGDDEGTT